MPRDFKLQKQAILAGAIVLVFADVVLAAYSLRLSSAPRSPLQELNLQLKQLEILKADIKRAQDIREKMPTIKKDCDRFENSLFPAATGYSSITSELGDIAKKAGLQIETLGLKQKEIPEHGVTEIALDATVTGDYKNVVLFLNGVQRSPNLYVVDGLGLGSENTNQGPTGAVKVALHMKTYFRTAS
jgi:type IV pilus assembly protein PilO